MVLIKALIKIKSTRNTDAENICVPQYLLERNSIKIYISNYVGLNIEKYWDFDSVLQKFSMWLPFCYGTYLMDYNELFLLLWIQGEYSSRC